MAEKIIAQELAKAQRAISVSEFFRKNKHLLGFDNPIKSLLTSVKEAVDNSLDACEEANILPDIFVQITEVDTNRFKLIVEDNGPGIVKSQIGPIFGKLLYGSKFQTFGGKQGRGQQGIGISAAILNAQETTGKPARIISKIHKSETAHVFELKIDIDKNEPVISNQTTIEWNKEHGTRIEMELEAKYVEKKASVVEYIKETAIVNPHSHIVYIDPQNQKFDFPRVSDKLPKKPEKIKPHPYGVEIGMLERMLKDTSARTIKTFLTTEFDKVGASTAEDILKNAGFDPQIGPKFLTLVQIEKLLKAMQGTKIRNPSTDCLSPIGAELLKKSLESEYNLEFAYAVSRQPAVYQGNPFQIEVAIGYGGELPKEEPIKLFRFANRVPLLYQQGACAVTKAATAVDWKNYGLDQSGANLPVGPAIVIIHMASVWVPFTSESKEAIAHYPEIIKEVKLALQEAGRQLQIFVGKKFKKEIAKKKKEMFENYSEELASSISSITGEKKEEIQKKLLKIADEMLETGAIEEEEEVVKAEKEKPKRKIGAFKKGEDEDDE